MRLRDALVALFERDDLTAYDFLDNTSSNGLADAVLALLRERGQPMWCASILFNEWAIDDTLDAGTARFLLLDLGEDTE